MSVIETLTEGIRQRSLANEGEALLGKWERTGLLEGLDDVKRSNMARLRQSFGTGPCFGPTDEPPEWTHFLHGLRVQSRWRYGCC